MNEFCFDFNTIITKELLLSKHSQETYMEHYLGVHVGKQLFKSPLRSDKRPTCAFRKNEKGVLYMKDFGESRFYGDFIAVVMYKYSVDYQNALKIIANDFFIVEDKSIQKHSRKIDYSNKILDETEPCSIQVEMQEFTQRQLNWWSSFGITKETLKRYNIYSCNNVFLNGNFFSHSTDKIPMYGYYWGKIDNIEHWRIYMPTKKTYRFLSNWNKSMIQGVKQLDPSKKDLIVITKSLKDVMLLHEYGIEAIAPNSESTFLSDRQLQSLKNKYKEVVLFYDNDLPGLSSMKKIKDKYGVKCVWLPRDKAKDISDFRKKYGHEETLKMIENGRKSIEA